MNKNINATYYHVTVDCNISGGRGIVGAYGYSQYDVSWSGRSTTTPNYYETTDTMAIEIYNVSGYTIGSVSSRGGVTNLKGPYSMSGGVYYTFKITGNASLYVSYTPSTTYYTISVSADEGGRATGGGSYPSGANVSITATANEGYAFDYWSETGTSVRHTENPFTFTANSNRSFTAHFKKRYVISITQTGPTGAGSTTGAGLYYSGDTTTLRAYPNNGYKFVGWYQQGSLLSRQSYLYISVTGNATYEARFDDDYVSLRLKSDEPGPNIYAPSLYSEWFNDKTFTVRRNVSIHITAADPIRYTTYYFSRWSDNVTDFDRDYTPTGDTNTLIAYYENRNTVVTVNNDRGGSTNPPPGRYTITGGSLFNIEVDEEEPGYEFIRYDIIDGTEQYSLYNRSISRTFSSTSATIYARFDIIKCHIEVRPESADVGSTIPSGDLVYEYGELFTAQAYNSVDGWAFDHWVTSARIPLEEPNNPVIRIESLRVGHEGNYIAYYKRTTTENRTVTIGTDPDFPGGYVVITDEPTVHYTTPTGVTKPLNVVKQLHAQPDAGYRLLSWSDGVIPNNPRAVAWDRDKTVLAQFYQSDVYRVSLTAEPSSYGTVEGSGSYPSGRQIIISAIANTGYKFVKWSDGITQPIRQITVTRDITLIAYFTTQKPIVSIISHMIKHRGIQKIIIK